MNKRLEGKTALITGSARGIGEGIASLFAREGANIVLSDVNDALLKDTETRIRAAGVDVLSCKSDVTNSADVDEMIKKVVDKFGKIDILVNNAGITRDGLLIRMSEADWDLVLAVNLKGAFLCTRAVSKVMIKQRFGKIINIASIIGIAGNAGQANYAASKGGIIAFTKSMGKELGSRNITVNAVAPGFIKTDMTDRLPEDSKKAMLSRIPLNRFGDISDVACAVLFLASDEANYITGCTIQVDGGIAV